MELANDVRAALFGISFGDQVQIFRRSLVDGPGFPDMPLMEDVELSVRLLSMGTTEHLFGSTLVSDRKWRAKSGARTVLVLSLTAEYMIRRITSAPYGICELYFAACPSVLPSTRSTR